MDITAYESAVNDLHTNEGQWKVFVSEANCVVLAGPGSGKTKTLSVKVAQMLQKDVFYPQRVACITYSNECARELDKRIKSLGPFNDGRVYVGTVHGFCLSNIVAPYVSLTTIDLPKEWSIAGPSAANECRKVAVEEIYGTSRKPSNTEIDAYRRAYIDRNSEGWDRDDPHIAATILRYEEELRNRGLIDFDDIVLTGLRMVHEYPWIVKILRARFPILVVDEYQDLGYPLHHLVQTLCFESGIRLLAVGDPNQSIYGFTGANPVLLKNLSEHPEVESIELNLNYRCATSIVRASEKLLAFKEGTFGTPSDASQGTIDIHHIAGGLPAQSEFICDELIPRIMGEIEGCQLGDIAVLYIDMHDGDVIAAAAEESGIDYIRIDNNAPYRKSRMTRWAEDCAKWCAGGWREGEPRLSDLVRSLSTLAIYPTNSQELLMRQKHCLVNFLWNNRAPEASAFAWVTELTERCLNSLIREEFLLPDELSSFQQMVDSLAEGGKLEAFLVQTLAGQRGAPDHLNLITLHSAKGLEYKAVILMGMEQGRIPWNNDTVAAKAEKRRLFYVGLTRAKKAVHITYSGYFFRKARKLTFGASEFVVELEEQLA